jgi:hypothetical protein
VHAAHLHASIYQKKTQHKIIQKENKGAKMLYFCVQGAA